ncbi:MAG: response regulator [Candidatus Andersenbacteria bacterium]
MPKSATKVLIVDDDEAIAEALRIILTIEGFAVATAAQEAAAYRQIIAEQPDLIIMDIFLAGEDGRELARSLKTVSATKDIPIIMISAHPLSFESLQETGADEFLPKPFEVADLMNSIHRCVPGLSRP